MTITRRAVLAASVVSLGLSTTIMAGLQDSEPPRVIGRWDMAVVASGTTYPSWLEVQRSGTRTLVGRFVGSGGSARPISKIDFAANVLRFSIPPQWEQGDDDLRLEGTLDGDRLSGWMTDPAGKRLTWTASRAPTLRRTSPPEWGAPIRLLDGTDMAAWQPSRERASGASLTAFSPISRLAPISSLASASTISGSIWSFAARKTRIAACICGAATKCRSKTARDWSRQAASWALCTGSCLRRRSQEAG
jgi:hypothetical protein